MVKWLGFYRINWGNPCFLSRLFWWGDCWGHPLLQTGWYVLIGRNICWAIPHYVMSHLRRGVCDDIVILVYCAHVLRPSIQTGTDPVVIWMLTTEISGFSAAQSAQVSRKTLGLYIKMGDSMKIQDDGRQSLQKFGDLRHKCCGIHSNERLHLQKLWMYLLQRKQQRPSLLSTADSRAFERPSQFARAKSVHQTNRHGTNFLES